MEEMTEIPQSLLWALCDRALFASAFQAAIEFELIVLQWAFKYLDTFSRIKFVRSLVRSILLLNTCYPDAL